MLFFLVIAQHGSRGNGERVTGGRRGVDEECVESRRRAAGGLGALGAAGAAGRRPPVALGKAAVFPAGGLRLGGPHTYKLYLS